MTAAWTLRFTEWQCGHHGQRPEDIACSSPEQAKAILWAIACAISQPGHARACLFDDTRGFADIYITDDYCEFKPDRTPSYRPAVVLCADDATAAAILAPELKDAREDISEPDLWQAKVWDGKELVETNSAYLTTMTREAVEALAQVDDTSLEPRMPLFELPPVFHDGAGLAERLRTIAAEMAAYEAEVAAENQRAVDADEAADLKRDEQRLNGES